jgi:hypothetical protein
VVVDVCLYYGNTKLSQKQTQSIPLVKDIKPSLQETKTYEITILNDNLVFNQNEFDQEPSGFKDIYTFITVKYKNIGKLLR